MNILAIDTSNLPLSVAVITEERVLGECTFNVERNHSIRLMPAIASLMEQVRLTPKDIDLFVVARGPGSYTGVRIGVTTAKSLAWAVGKPLVGVSSLLALAQEVPYFNGVVVPLFDARRDRVYAAGYAWQDGTFVEVIPEQVIHRDALVELLGAKDVLFLGDDGSKHRDFFVEKLGTSAHFLPSAYQIPRAAFLAEMGLQLYKQGHREGVTFAPTYLQVTEAEVNLGKK